MNYKHIILTRFNLPFDLQSNIHIQREWLTERMRLFEQYCLPSIVQQTNRQFTWVILASDQTPRDMQNMLLSLTAIYPFIHILFCAYTNDLNALYQQVGEKYVQGYDYLLSTRIDSDDMLSANFCQALQSSVQNSLEEGIYTFPNGIQWFERNHLTHGVRYDKNHFLSFFESASHVKTCLGFDHTKVSTQQLIRVCGIAMWCEIVHGNNICNAYTPAYRYSAPIISEGSYPISFPLSNTLRQYLFLMREHIRFRYHQLGRGLRKLVGRHNS